MAPAEAIASITNLVNLYAVAVDTQRWVLFDQVFTPDVAADFGGPAAWTGLDPLKQAFAAIHAPFRATMHVTTNHHVAAAGERATCLSYVHGRFFRDVAEGGDMFESGGWYDDELRLTGHGWRIARRACRTTWWGGNPLVLQTSPEVNVEHALHSLRDEAAGGRLGHLRQRQAPA